MTEITKTKVLFPIGVKLVLIITAMFLLSLGAVIAIVSILSTADARRTAEYNNFTINARAGSQAESSFKSLQDTVIIYLDMINKYGRDTDIENNFYNRNRNIAAIWTARPLASQMVGQESAVFIPNAAFFLSKGISENDAKQYLDTLQTPPEMFININIFNASPFFNTQLLAAVFTCRLSGDKKEEYTIVKVLFSPDDLSESFGMGTNTSFLINEKNDVLLHPEIDLVLRGENFYSAPILSFIQQEEDRSGRNDATGTNGRQVSFFDEKNEESYFVAHHKLAGTDSTVITTIPYTVVFEAVRSITLQNIFLAIAVLFITIIFIWFFSKTISSPVRLLAEAALKIEGGEFNIDLKRQTRDEIGLLTDSFGKMTTALNIFGRFTNKDIAVRAMSGDIKPGGLPKHATIFFSDIRGFTEKSENFTKTFGEEASNRIVEWLNEYFTHMVACVEKTGGVIDKFIGDAVMAHWGTATTAGSPEEDAFNAVKTALMMRNALYKLNKQRQKDAVSGEANPINPEIRIGCGLNSGIVTAGQIGSNERMEYTVIGDPVNLASRTEALNKPLGTDILITENTWRLCGNKFITEEMPPVSVKGKAQPVRLFAVINLKGAQGPQTLAQVRKLLNIDAVDISKVDTNAEEKKYKI